MKVIIRGVSKNAKTSAMGMISAVLVSADPALAVGTLIIWSPDECVLAACPSEAKSYLEIHAVTESDLDFLKEALYPLGYDMHPHIMRRHIKAEKRVPLSFEAIKKCTSGDRLIDGDGGEWLIRSIDSDEDSGSRYLTLFLESKDDSHGAPTTMRLNIVAGSVLGFDDVERILINDDNSLSSKFMDTATRAMKGTVVYRR